MEAYIVDWLQLVLRWTHMITGIAWIGASFYFVWLDNHLQTAPQWQQARGIGGELWAIHGGGVYEVGKYRKGPEQMPDTLHWFKWEAYTTWISGMLLLAAVYYLGADAYLIDRRVADLSAPAAIGLGLAFIVLGWFIYDVLCNSRVANHTALLSSLLLLMLVASSYALTHLFSGRGAYIHIGAMIGTMMVGNVFAVIMPSQRALVSAIEQGGEVDPSWGAKAKLRSTHNTYLTLPLLFIMISNHYPMTYGHEYNWLILLAITAITACVRQFFVLRHKGIVKPALLVGSVVATLVLAALITPPSLRSSQAASAIPTLSEMHTIVSHRCGSCHSAEPTDDVFTVAPAGVILDTESQVRQWAPRILARSVHTQDMPFMNKTGMTDAERQQLGVGLIQLED
ncbi:urate hydroxylase PuuD [Aestuariicella hydrocarbonica]|uniref:Urate hydroxylase PuuD n=1 Tax=Pseudomaricurvus hydrocarbonicus TaxID=1470433 RepID=A0A9E5JWM4_9GAMM|nr:urate hydroxylase PuuD [Aestuariicella hydrocarbonica]NHO66250.1 urate hydroxylase PuuD [Aestuariicella hydrocarbonica]